MANVKYRLENQLEKANAILQELRPNITEQDRKDATQELNLSMPTLKRYLLGEAKNIDTALLLIGFFRGKIEKRELVLRSATAA